MSQARESRPAGNQAAQKMFSAGNSPIIPTGADRTAAEALITGVHVVVVEMTAGRYRRRVMFNLPAAQRAVDRATMAGHSAHIFLCKLIPAGDA